MSFRARAGALALICLGLASPLQAKQWGMVVGIDDYRHFQPFPAPPGQLSDLEGAVNDANRISGAMRSTSIDLPPERLLINEDATVENFLKGWNDILARAQTNDTIVVSFSGHGAQEREVSEPFDEVTDQLDETIMFHEFDPSNPRKGRLSDDQLRDMLAAASNFKIIWVMDSCHSAGLTRSVNRENMGLTRNGGIWDIPLDPIADEIIALEGDTGQDDMPHVTQILATASEDRLVQETRFDGKAHGALSWFFAEALTGAADLNKDDLVTRSEIAEYLQDRVFTHMNQNQQPRILPRGDSQTLLSLAPAKSDDVPLPKFGVPVKFKGAPPPGLRPGTYTEVRTSPSVVYEQSGNGWIVYNHTGDEITRITSGADRLISRALALDHVRKSKKSGIPAIGIRADHPNTVNPVGAIVGYTFTPPAPDYAYLTLFNIASDGTLQYLHPINPSQNEAVRASGFPVRFRVTPPTGADQLVAVYCKRPPIDLQHVLASWNGQTAPADDTLALALSSPSCQTGVVGLFTKDK